MAKHKRLQPGAVVSVFRPGGGVGDALGQHVVPDDGSNLRIRDLAPGAYEARDSTGREVSFEVDAGDEVATIPVVGVAAPEPAEWEADQEQLEREHAERLEDGEDEPRARREHEGRHAPAEQGPAPTGAPKSDEQMAPAEGGTPGAAKESLERSIAGRRGAETRRQREEQEAREAEAAAALADPEAQASPPGADE